MRTQRRHVVRTTAFFIVFALAAPSHHTRAATIGGWDPHITKRCAWTPSPTKPNFYSDTTSCPGANFDTDPHWRLWVQSEGPGGTCPGPSSQSFRINGSGSPTQMTWFGGGCDTYTVEMKIGWGGLSHPCGGGYATSLAMADHAAGYHPSLATLASHHSIAMFGHSGAYKASLNIGNLEWGGKKHYLSLYLRPNAFWLPDNHPAPGIRWRGTNADGSVDIVALDANYFGFPNLCPGGTCNGAFQEFNVDWWALMGYVQAQGIWTAAPLGTLTPRVSVELEVLDQGSVRIQHWGFWISG